MTTTINHSDDTRADAGAMNDTTDPDPEVPERARAPPVLGQVQGEDPGRVRHARQGR